MQVKFGVMTMTGVDIAVFDSNDLCAPGASREQIKNAAEKIYKQMNPNVIVISFDFI